CSPHPAASALAGAAWESGLGPVTATSLNRSGAPPARTRAEAAALCGADLGAVSMLGGGWADGGGRPPRRARRPGGRAPRRAPRGCDRRPGDPPPGRERRRRMTDVAPFRALRYDPARVDLARALVPPYD